MAEQTFRSPNFFEREIDQSAREAGGPVGTPAGLIGTSQKGPAFFPITVATFSEFISKFGNLDFRKYAPYAANEFLKHRSALTFMRVLGAGSNESVADIAKAQLTDRVKNAGFFVTGTAADNDSLGRHMGCVQFLAAAHTFTSNETWGYPVFTDNDSFGPSSGNIVRGMLLMASGARVQVLGGAVALPGNLNSTTSDLATVSGDRFKLVLSSALGTSFGNGDGLPGIRVYSASMNPTDDDYFAKLLNRDPEKFESEQHVLYADFAVDAELAVATSVAILSGSSYQSNNSGETSFNMRTAFGHFDTRYRAPSTSWFISQPFGKTEYDLFRFEAIDDGEYANKLYKISISNIRASLDDSRPYGTFTVLIRSWNDSDTNQDVLETFPNCTLDPTSDNFIARVIGDRKVYFNFDAESESERRFVANGKYANRSQLVRVIVHENVEKALTPVKCLPFGFRGPQLLKTNDSLADASSFAYRLGGVGVNSLSASILPPLPLRFKVTRGEVQQSGFVGSPGPTELANGSLFWGVKYERTTDPLNSNITSEKNTLLEAYSKMLGLSKLDVLVTGSGADTLNNNKFTLAKVALANSSLAELTASVNDHMREAAYMRDATLDPTDYTVNDPALANRRLTFGSLVALTSSVDFNRFTQFMKFTNMMYGGFDGVNILDKNAKRMNDKASSFDAGGGAEASYVAPGLRYNPNGTGPTNNTVSSYLAAASIMLNSMVSTVNVLAIPGIREPYITDQVAAKAKSYGLALYLMDLVPFDDSSNRLYDDSVAKPDVEKTIALFEGRGVDNDYTATYFPDVFINDEVNSRRVKVPSSVAAIAALALNDRVAYPWFAPAGFNRAALDFVTNVPVRLSVDDRDKLYDSRINPIATFPRQGFVIFGQKTLKIKKSALDRVNVRRMLLEIKRTIVGVASRLVFEQNTQDVRNKFLDEAGAFIALVQAQQGIESFKIIMDDSNNTQEDKDLNRLNGKVIVVPTRAVEFISIDFVITNSGVQFTS